MRKLIVLIIMFCVPTIVMATTSILTVANKKSEQQKKLEEICIQFEEEGVPKEIAKGPHVQVGKAMEWVINNTNKPDGWSFTGFAELNVNEKGQFNRWKFGIINGELDWVTYENLEKTVKI